MLVKCKTVGCFSDGVCGDDRCVVHTRSKKRLLEHTGGRRKPRSSLPHLGVELECFAPDDAVYAIMMAQDVAPCHDGSLPSLGCEFKICLPLRKLERKIVELASKLQAGGATVNNRCGLHVHLDAREIPTVRITVFLRWLESWQEWLFSIMPPSRRSNAYCVRLPSHYNNHYLWANRTPHGTVEIRIHGGTLNPHKLVGWLHVCESLRKMLWGDEPFPDFEAESGTAHTSPTDAWMAKVFDAKAVEYLRARERGNGVLVSINNTANGQRREEEGA